ncbi:lytic transglycosylase domain-containing protein [Accumulibacter sp.]|uniref:lytic transglycosylase domain-containing protein n=1 Tax=Accumulibacter sp. TaxID=2053492 RepID=UPI0035B30949
MRRSALLVLFLATGLHGLPARADGDVQTPRVQAALAQAHAAEAGRGMGKNLMLAMAFYCDAGTMGSGEGFFHVGRVLASAPRPLRNPGLANSYLALATRLGNTQALRYYDPRVDNVLLGDPCGAFAAGLQTQRFDIEAYLSRQPRARQRIAASIRSAARQNRVDERLALAIALVESNLDPAAVPKGGAQGVMQLATAARQNAGGLRIVDDEQDIGAALAYLGQLHERFAGDWRSMARAYDAGAGSVGRCGAVPPHPCLETRQYVRRVLYFAGASPDEQPGIARQVPAAARSPHPGGVADKRADLPCCG